MFPIIIVSPKFTKLMSIFIDVYAITIFPFIISKEKMDKVTLNHEKIHIQQQKEMLVIFFYLFYAYFFVRNYLIYKDTHVAYMLIPFEKEARLNHNNQYYLEKRQFYSWINYIE